MKARGCGHSFSEIFLHLNWHCKRDEPMIRPDVEPRLHRFIEEYCREIRGVHFEAVGGTETHVHLAFQMEPAVSLAGFIGQVKGASSHEMNKAFGRDTVKWQRGYGIVSFSKKYLPGIVRYVHDQKKHHGAGTANDALEAHDPEVRADGG
jgi:REP-associated tyrosine transposase